MTGFVIGSVGGVFALLCATSLIMVGTASPLISGSVVLLTLLHHRFAAVRNDVLSAFCEREDSDYLIFMSPAGRCKTLYF